MIIIIDTCLRLREQMLILFTYLRSILFNDCRIIFYYVTRFIILDSYNILLYLTINRKVLLSIIKLS